LKSLSHRNCLIITNGKKSRERLFKRPCVNPPVKPEVGAGPVPYQVFSANFEEVFDLVQALPEWRSALPRTAEDVIGVAVLSSDQFGPKNVFLLIQSPNPF
jgi:hypothetical protein